jgi:hypothetical protein
VQYQTTYRVRGAPGVVGELVEGRVALLHHVLPEGVDEVAQERDRKVVSRDRRGDALEAGRGRAPRLDRVERLDIPREPREALARRCIALVRDVVRAAREAVDRLDRGAQPRGQEPGCDGEVLVVVDGQGGVGSD